LKKKLKKKMNQTLDFSEVDKILEEGLEVLADEFGQQQIEEIKFEKWSWDNITYRKEGKGRTGKIAGSPRDIVDTGELRDSLSINRVSSEEYLYTYDADHAILVHEGERVSNGSYIPPRPWITSAAEEYDLADNFASILRERLS
jgi:hypothetical protein